MMILTTPLLQPIKNRGGFDPQIASFHRDLTRILEDLGPHKMEGQPHKKRSVGF